MNKVSKEILDELQNIMDKFQGMQICIFYNPKDFSEENISAIKQLQRVYDVLPLEWIEQGKIYLFPYKAEKFEYIKYTIEE